MATIQPSLSLINGKNKGDYDAHLQQANLPVTPNSENDSCDSKLKSIHTAFKKLFAGPVPQNGRSAAHTILAEHYPGHHLVNVYPYTFDLDTFASAGHATIEIDYVDNCYDVGRKYKAPHGGRTYSSDAKVVEKVYWARSKYTWQGHEFLLFYASWKIAYDQEVYWQFLLYPRTPGALVEAKSEHIDNLLLAVGQFSEQPHQDIFVFEDKWTYRDKDMYHSIKDAHWDDVIIDPAMKKAIVQDVVSFFEPATKNLYMRYRLPYKRGVILHGSPGNGKTITIKALINHLQNLPEPVPTLYVKSMKDKCKGDQESLKELFKDARRRAPILLVLEDLDSLVHGDIRSHFLNEIDGLQSLDGVLILGSTNHLSNIDSAISSRPSRFDRKYAFELPDRAGRQRYAQHWRNKLADNEDIDFTEDICSAVADLTPEFSFAYLKELFISTLLIVSRGEENEEIGNNDVVDEKSNSEPTAVDAAAVDKDKRNEEVKQSKRIEVPDITISDALKANSFFTTLHKQVKLLIKDMNDAAAKEEEKKSKNDKDKDKKKDGDEDESCSSC